jgi:hypothetical protein
MYTWKLQPIVWYYSLAKTEYCICDVTESVCTLGTGGGVWISGWQRPISHCHMLSMNHGRRVHICCHALSRLQPLSPLCKPAQRQYTFWTAINGYVLTSMGLLLLLLFQDRLVILYYSTASSALLHCNLGYLCVSVIHNVSRYSYLSLANISRIMVTVCYSFTLI